MFRNFHVNVLMHLTGCVGINVLVDVPRRFTDAN